MRAELGFCRNESEESATRTCELNRGKNVDVIVKFRTVMKDKKRKRSIFESTANLAVTDSKICLYNRLEMGEGERVYLFIKAVYKTFQLEFLRYSFY